MNRARIALVLAAAVAPLTLLAASPAIQPPAAYEGRPEFKEGSDRSYFIWREGDDWHVRWTTMGVARRFTGTVRAIGGKLDDLKRIDVEAELKVIRPGRPGRVVRGPAGRVRGVAPGRPPVVASKEQDHIEMADDDHVIRWASRTDADIDGFRFKVNNNVQELRFDLRIEGESRPASVEIGRKNVHPRDNPFSVRIR